VKHHKRETVDLIVEKLRDLFPPDHPKHTWAQGVIVTLNAEAEDPPIDPP